MKVLQGIKIMCEVSYSNKIRKFIIMNEIIIDIIRNYVQKYFITVLTIRGFSTQCIPL